jgi:stalled ribosome rescue protein Dom34
MTLHAAVWLDHNEAKIYHLVGSDFDEKTVHGPPKHHLHHSARKGGNESHAVKEYFDAVVAALGDAQEILVAGPGPAKLELVRHLHRNAPKIEERIVGVESAGHPSDGQFVDHLRRYFKAKDRMLGIAR